METYTDLSTLLLEWKNKSGSAFGQLPKIFINKKNSHLLKQLEDATNFLPVDIPINQRLYHIFFNKKLEVCECGNIKKFTGKFSPKIIETIEAKQTNYFSTCENTKCRLNYLISRSKINNSTEQLISKIKKNRSLYDEVIKRTSFLNNNYDNINIAQRFYHIWFDYLALEHCPYCNNLKKFSTLNKFSTDRYGKNDTNHSNYCGTCMEEKCNNKHNLIMTKDAVQAKYGVEYFSQTEAWHDKVKKTNNEKYGVDYPTQMKDFQEKSKNTCIKKYGVEHHTKAKSVQDKKRDTVIIRYGVNCVMQDPTIFRKSMTSAMKWKLFQFPSRMEIKVQGYEPFAVRDLLSSGIKEDDIIIKNKEIEDNIGKIWYTGTDDKQHKYYPDIYIKSLNKVIEVKSEYTYNCALTINERKRVASESLGLLFEFWIYNKSGEKITIP